MSIFLGYMDQIWFIDCILIILPKLRAYSTCVWKYINNSNFGTVDRNTSTRNIIPSPLEPLHGNDLQWKLNSGKWFYNKIAEEVVFLIRPYDMPLFITQRCTSKRILLMCTYRYCIIWNQMLALDFNPSWGRDIIDPACFSPTHLPIYFPLPSFPYCATLLLDLTSVQDYCILTACFYVIWCPM